MMAQVPAGGLYEERGLPPPRRLLGDLGKPPGSSPPLPASASDEVPSLTALPFAFPGVPQKQTPQGGWVKEVFQLQHWLPGLDDLERMDGFGMAGTLEPEAHPALRRIWGCCYARAES